MYYPQNNFNNQCIKSFYGLLNIKKPCLDQKAPSAPNNLLLRVMPGKKHSVLMLLSHCISTSVPAGSRVPQLPQALAFSNAITIQRVKFTLNGKLQGFQKIFPKAKNPRCVSVLPIHEFCPNTVQSWNRVISVLMTTFKQLPGPQFISFNYKLNVALLDSYILFTDINHICRNWNSLLKNLLSTA